MNYQSEKLSRENIIIDGHIDLPFRLYKKNLLFEKKIELDKETSGNFDIQWDASNYNSGIYFIKCSTQSEVIIQKILLVK